MNSILQSLFILFIALVFNSCNNHSTQNPIVHKHAILAKEAVTQNTIDNAYFNLPNLPIGVDSFEIRICPESAFPEMKHLFIFKKTKNWTGYHYCSYTIPIIDQDGQTLHYFDKFKVGDSVFMVRQINPNCGWQAFEDSLRFFQIDALPTQDSIPGFVRKLFTDGSGYTIEIVEPTSYKMIRYWLPSVYDDPTNQKFVFFIQMIKRQLGKNYFWPNKSQ